MKLDSYLSRSRHAVFYFRWPIPRSQKSDKRQTLRISLGTRCPKLAVELARHLAASGATVWRTGVRANMRHDELRAAVHAVFKRRLAMFREKIDVAGPMSEAEASNLHMSVRLAEGTPDDFREYGMIDAPEAYLRRFCEASGIPASEAEARPDRLQQEIQKAQRDMLREIERHHASLGGYDFADGAVQHRAALTIPAALAPSITLAQAVDEYIAENRRADARCQPDPCVRRNRDHAVRPRIRRAKTSGS